MQENFDYTVYNKLQYFTFSIAIIIYVNVMMLLDSNLMAFQFKISYISLVSH